MDARRFVPLLAALALGFVFGWLVREGTRSPVADASRAGSAPDAPTILPDDRTPRRTDPATSLDAGGTRPAPNGPGPAPAAAADATAKAGASGPTLPFIELTVVAGPGTPPDWKATAYLLAAGAKGADKPEELPHAEVTVDHPERLVAPAAGLYDVGLVNEAMQLLETDVRATAEGTRIRVTLPPMAPVRFRLSNGIPPDEPNTEITGFVSLERAREPLKWNDLPGRGEVRSRGPLVKVEGEAGTTFETPPVLSNESFTLDLDLREEHKEGNSTSFDFSDRWELAAEPRTVRGGDLVTLTVVSLGRLRLAMNAAPSAVKFPRRLEVEFTRAEDGAYESRSGHGDLDEETEGLLRRELIVPLAPGHWTVSWSGPGVLPGRLEGVVIASSAMTAAVIEVGTRAVETQPGDGREEAVVGVELESPLTEREPWSVYAREGETWNGSGPKPPEVPGDLRGKRAVLVVGADRVSAEEEVPAVGPWRPRLLRPGFVMFAPKQVFDPSLGGVTVERPDGFPVALYKDRGWSRGFHPELVAQVTPGLLLGPFAPGPLELEVFVARKSLGVVKLSIAAGAIVPLTIPGR